MDAKQLIAKVHHLIDNAGAAVFTTSDKSAPFSRWMTPVLIDNYGPVIYACSVPAAKKIEHIKKCPRGEWMIQSRDLREIVNLAVDVRIIENPSLRAELMDILGPRLNMFFRANADSEDWVVLESRIISGEYFMPVKGYREKVEFTGK